jgi:hypothetical protein
MLCLLLVQLGSLLAINASPHWLTTWLPAKITGRTELSCAPKFSKTWFVQQNITAMNGRIQLQSDGDDCISIIRFSLRYSTASNKKNSWKKQRTKQLKAGAALTSLLPKVNVSMAVCPSMTKVHDGDVLSPWSNFDLGFVSTTFRVICIGMCAIHVCTRQGLKARQVLFLARGSTPSPKRAKLFLFRKNK